MIIFRLKSASRVALILAMVSTGVFGLAISASAEETATAEESGHAEAIFAGGCFWCMEPPFDKLAGVKETISGYIGGKIENPTYKQVSGGRSGHYEALRVVYDPSVVSYEQLLEVFWVNVDPLDASGQFCDKGPQYLTGIFYLNEAQKKAAEKSKKQLARQTDFKSPIVTEVIKAIKFYPAEDYHQDYYEKNPVRYKYYRYRCGRDERLEALWGK